MNDSMCPICGSNDAVQRIGGLVDGQTSDSRGIAVSYVGRGNGLGGFAPTMYGSLDMTRLAQRLSPYKMRPGDLNGLVLAFCILAFPISVAIWCHNKFTPTLGADDTMLWWVTTFLWMAAGIPVGLLLLLACWGIYFLAMKSERQLWYTQWGYLNNGFYCARDDVAFNPDGFGTPEEFVNFCFRLSYQEMGYV